MGKISGFFKSPNFQKYSAIGLLLIILAAIPLTLSQVSKQQVTNQNAAVGPGQGIGSACGITITAQDNPACTGGNASVNSYQTTYTLVNNSGSSVTLTYLAQTYVCLTKSDYSGNSCLKNYVPFQKQITVAAHATSTITPDSRSVSQINAGYSFCGYYQNDFSFTTSSGCTFGNPNTVALFGFCHTPVDCTATTPTPTPGVTVTDTPIPSDTPTPGITITDTPTPGTTITPTNTPGPTATPNPSDTPTPTNNPTNTPTPIIATNTPKPTLPPTGPGNTLVSVGVIGLIIAIAGITLSMGF